MFFRQTVNKTLVLQQKTRRPEEKKKNRRKRNKDTPIYTLISRRVTHARNANTNTKHDFLVGGVTKDSPPPTSDTPNTLQQYPQIPSAIRLTFLRTFKFSIDVLGFQQRILVLDRKTWGDKGVGCDGGKLQFYRAVLIHLLGIPSMQNLVDDQSCNRLNSLLYII